MPRNFLKFMPKLGFSNISYGQHKTKPIDAK